MAGYVARMGMEMRHLCYDAAYSRNTLPTFQDNLSVPSSRAKKSKKTAFFIEVLSHTQYWSCKADEMVGNVARIGMRYIIADMSTTRVGYAA